jgi:hypothetical protein
MYYRTSGVARAKFHHRCSSRVSKRASRRSTREGTQGVWSFRNSQTIWRFWGAKARLHSYNGASARAIDPLAERSCVNSPRAVTNTDFWSCQSKKRGPKSLHLQQILLAFDGRACGKDWHCSLKLSQKTDDGTFSEFCGEEPCWRLANPQMFKDTHPHLFNIAGSKDSLGDNTLRVLSRAKAPRLVACAYQHEGDVPFSIIFQLRPSENRKNTANPAFFELNCKLPKLRTWVRFPSPAPENKALRPTASFSIFSKSPQTPAFFREMSCRAFPVESRRRCKQAS